MSDYITIDEQEELALRRHIRGSNYVAPYTHNEITAPEQGVVNAALTAAGTVMAHRQMNFTVVVKNTRGDILRKG